MPRDQGRKESLEECDEIPAKRSKRQRKKPGSADQVVASCPMCNMGMRVSELKAHLSWEVDRLNKYCRKQHRLAAATATAPRTPTATVTTASAAAGSSEQLSESPQSPVAGPSFGSDEAEEDEATTAATMARLLSPEMRYNTYREIRGNRYKRLQARRRLKPGEEEGTCPVCDQLIIGQAAEITDHVEVCLRQQEENETAEIDIEGDGSADSAGGGYEEYTWAGETRVRSVTLIDSGSFADQGFQVVSRDQDNNEDEDVDIDDIADDEFGPSQYVEADVVPPGPSDDDDLDDLETSLQRRTLRLRAAATGLGSSFGAMSQPGSGLGSHGLESLTHGHDDGITCDVCVSSHLDNIHRELKQIGDRVQHKLNGSSSSAQQVQKSAGGSKTSEMQNDSNERNSSDDGFHSGPSQNPSGANSSTMTSSSNTMSPVGLNLNDETSSPSKSNQGTEDAASLSPPSPGRYIEACLLLNSQIDVLACDNQLAGFRQYAKNRYRDSVLSSSEQCIGQSSLINSISETSSNDHSQTFVKDSSSTGLLMNGITEYGQYAGRNSTNENAARTQSTDQSASATHSQMEQSDNTSHPLPTPSRSSIRYPPAESPLIASLLNRIKELESQLAQAANGPSGGVSCLICMSPYQRPLTSVVCWHVHCEDCWLRSLGAKKVCPQCNVITAPGNLRRIYL